MHILVVEDEKKVASFIRRGLEAEGYRVDVAHDGDAALTRALATDYDLLVLDVMLPGQDGLCVLHELRARRRQPPVLLLTARGGLADKVAGLDAGADDYLTKPFEFPELLARVRASLRRNVRGSEQVSTVRIGEADIELERRHATGPNGELHLTPLEYRVLESLVRHSGRIVRPEQLLREAWGPDKSGDTRTLRVCIKNLRDKLEPDPRRPQYLLTETGLGYRLRLP
jgi:DNA-binding response OmpR family regulator